jgi:DNA repair protein RadD
MNQFKPYPFQLEAMHAIINYFEQNSTGHCLVAMPTGVGKGSTIAMLIDYVLFNWPNQRILQLVHTKELVRQNYDDLLNLNPLAPADIYCAGLDRKETANAAIFGSLGSVRNNIEAFGHRDLIIVDEAHSISPDDETGYRQIIIKLTEINPLLRVVGFTATDYRLGQGKLTDGEDALFTDVCFDITKLQSFNRLIAEGFLSPLIVPSQLKTQLDVSGVAISKGDFNQGQLQKAVDKQEITYAAIQEAVQYGYNRHCWLVFASGIEHCEHISDVLNSFGIQSSFVHSKITDDERDARLLAFKEGKLQAIVGFRILTTGFNHKPIDMIIDLYPTVSPVMHVQKNGRGTRIYKADDVNFPYEKYNCLVLDFSGNTKRLGPVNDPIIPKKKGDKTGDAPIKICNAVHEGTVCGLYNHASARYCGGKPYPSDEGCGTEFTFQTKLLRTAGTDELIRNSELTLTIETFDVTRVIYHKHQKTGGKPCVKISYYSGLQRHTEYVHPEAMGQVRSKFIKWWQQRHASEPPTTTDEALIYSSQLRCPKRINVRVDLQFKEIISVEW